MAKAVKLGRHGFTLVEIMITILIISILTSLAVPAWFSARSRSQAKVCSGQLRQIKYAKEAWAMDTRQSTNSVADWGDLCPVYVKTTPECPSGGDYRILAVNTDPQCTIGGTHVVP